MTNQNINKVPRKSSPRFDPKNVAHVAAEIERKRLYAELDKANAEVTRYHNVVRDTGTRGYEEAQDAVKHIRQVIAEYEKETYEQA